MRHGSLLTVVLLIALTLLCAGLAGCTGTQSLSDGEVQSSGMVQDQARQTDEEQQVSAQGKDPHLSTFRDTEKQDSPAKLEITGTGPQTSVSSPLFDLSSPKDFEADRMVLRRPGPDGKLQKVVVMEGVSASASDPIAAYNEQVERIASATENMTDAQRDQVIQAAKSLENVVPELAGQIIRAVRGAP
jgi:hypothetical protein